MLSVERRKAMFSTEGSDDVPPSAGSASTSSYGQVITQRFLDAQNSVPFTASPEAIASNLISENLRSEEQRSSPSVVSSGGQRTLDDVRDQVADNIAVRTINRAETVDSSRVGVVTTLSTSSDPIFLRRIADKLKYRLTVRSYLFAVATSCPPGTAVPLLLCSSSQEFTQRASLLVNSKFTGRIVAGARSSTDGRMWFGQVVDLGASPFDEDALWDVVRKAARTLIDPLIPPPGSVGIEQRLAMERARLERVTPRAAYDELREPTSAWPVVLVDIRPEAQRREEGTIAGAMIVERNVLEWRFDPRCAYRLPVADRYDLRVIVFCSEGYTSSLAAASLRDLGMLNATDMIGGYQAWRADGLPAEVEVLATGMPIVIEDYSFT
jgi:rhodanese-related sulfurtransferase